MKKHSLPARWSRWCYRRYQALYAQGMATHLAWEIAIGEAKARHRVARIAGNKHAEEAAFSCFSTGGKLRFAISGLINGMTDDQIGRLEQMSLDIATKTK